jgi:RimJ/RimL family protein N-acetyltransferase
MNVDLGAVRLRPLEEHDQEDLYRMKNDAEIGTMLGGFHTGRSMREINSWILKPRDPREEIIWAIADSKTDSCVGHVGLYQIDHRIRSAEFAILIGDRALWGQGLGKTVTTAILEFGFNSLNLNRISLEVLSTNERAIRLYEKVGFKKEGELLSAQYKEGRYLDVVLMACLRDDRG